MHIRGNHAETGEVSECTVAANNGRYGPYLTKTGADGKSETRSLASEDEIFTSISTRPKNCSRSPSTAAGVAVVPPSRRCVIWARTRTPART